MTALPAWIVDVLDRGLPMLRGRERDELAEMILEAIPKDVVAETIRTSSAAVLKTRAIADAGGDLASEIGNNAGGAVVLMLQIGDDEPLWSCPTCADVDCDGCEMVPEASSPR